MPRQRFKGDKKKGESILSSLENKLVAKYIDKIPKGIETYHLTLTTIVWSVLIVVFSALAAQYNIHWLWGASVCIVLQYITDLFDGKIGMKRNTGLVKWGYYMDHFLDYIFLCSILIGYSFIVPPKDDYYLFFILALLGGFMVNSYLGFATLNEFKITYLKIGPTEARLMFIIINTLFIIFGKTYLAWSLPFSLIFSFIGLIIVVYRTQKYIWEIDMDNKRKSELK